MGPWRTANHLFTQADARDLCVICGRSARHHVTADTQEAER